MASGSSSAATPDGSAQLQEACASACELLAELSTKDVGLGEFKRKLPVSKRFIDGCDGLVFTWTLKAGALLGFTTGSGFIIRKASQDGHGPAWTAPCFVKVQAAQAGVILGVSKAASIMACGTRALADKLAAGVSPVLGGDVSFQVWPLMTGAEDSFDANLASPGSLDLLSISTGSGVIVDFSLKGGAMSVDAEKNAKCYGSGATPQALLSGQVASPTEFQPLYRALAEVK